MKTLTLLTVLIFCTGCAYNKQGQLKGWETAENILLAAAMGMAAKATLEMIDE